MDKLKGTTHIDLGWKKELNEIQSPYNEYHNDEVVSFVEYLIKQVIEDACSRLQVMNANPDEYKKRLEESLKKKYLS